MLVIQLTPSTGATLWGEEFLVPAKVTHGRGVVIGTHFGGVWWWQVLILAATAASGSWGYVVPVEATTGCGVVETTLGEDASLAWGCLLVLVGKETLWRDTCSGGSTRKPGWYEGAKKVDGVLELETISTSFLEKFPTDPSSSGTKFSQ